MILNVVQKYTHFIVTENFHIEIIINESLCQDKLCFQYRVFVSVFFFCSVYMQNLVQPVFIYTFSHVLYMHVLSNRMYSNNKASLKVNYIICLTSQMNNLKLSALQKDFKTNKELRYLLDFCCLIFEIVAVMLTGNIKSFLHDFCFQGILNGPLI